MASSDMPLNVPWIPVKSFSSWKEGHTETRTGTRTHGHTDTRTGTRTHGLAHGHTEWHTDTRTGTRTHGLTDVLTHTHTHTHTQTLLPFLSMATELNRNHQFLQLPLQHNTILHASTSYRYSVWVLVPLAALIYTRPVCSLTTCTLLTTMFAVLTITTTDNNNDRPLHPDTCMAFQCWQHLLLGRTHPGEKRR
jgi:hypothetical protein